MGHYLHIKPHDMSQYIQYYGVRAPSDFFEMMKYTDFLHMYPICVIENGSIKAAAVAFSRDEACDLFKNDAKKEWYRMHVSYIILACPEIVKELQLLPMDEAPRDGNAIYIEAVGITQYEDDAPRVYQDIAYWRDGMWRKKDGSNILGRSVGWFPLILGMDT